MCISRIQCGGKQALICMTEIGKPTEKNYTGLANVTGQRND